MIDPFPSTLSSGSKLAAVYSTVPSICSYNYQWNVSVILKFLLLAETIADDLTIGSLQGYEFASEAWKRVGLVTNSAADNTSGAGQSLKMLRAQKEAVKKELKMFDVCFCNFYGRQPRCKHASRFDAIY